MAYRARLLLCCRAAAEVVSTGTLTSGRRRPLAGQVQRPRSGSGWVAPPTSIHRATGRAESERAQFPANLKPALGVKDSATVYLSRSAYCGWPYAARVIPRHSSSSAHRRRGPGPPRARRGYCRRWRTDRHASAAEFAGRLSGAAAETRRAAARPPRPMPARRAQDTLRGPCRAAGARRPAREDQDWRPARSDRTSRAIDASTWRGWPRSPFAGALRGQWRLLARFQQRVG